MVELSVVLATRNEERNIGACLASVKKIADEVIVVDEESTDNTKAIAEGLGARVFNEHHQAIFHITKQKALDKATGDWILQLDADERVTTELAEEIIKIIKLNEHDVEKHQKTLAEKRLFARHKLLVEKRDGKVGQDKGGFVAFFIPRRNYFLGKYLKYGGTYPDGVIRLFKKGKAYLPCKSVHEQYVVEGRVGWLGSFLEHVADGNFKRYLKRNNYYINLMVKEMQKEKLRKNIVNFCKYVLLLPFWWFFLTQIRHKGILDGWQGVVFSFFSALRFPRAYWRYIIKR